MDLTNLPYNKEHINLLCRGFSFTPAPGPNEVELKIDLKEFSRKLCRHEFFLDTTQESKLVQNKSSFEPPNQRNQELDEIIDEIKNIKIEKPNPKDNLSKAERNALKEFKENKELVIKEADKGGAIVIMTKDQYRKMVMKHLDSDAYELVADKNIDKKVMQKIEEYTEKYSDLLEPEETKYISDFKYSTSNFYVLPKVHKSKDITRIVEENPVDCLKIKDIPEISSRPIVAGPNSPTHRLSTFLDIILQHLLM